MEYPLAPAGTPRSPLREPTQSLKRSDAASPCRTPAWLPTGKPTLEETRCENKHLQVNRCFRARAVTAEEDVVSLMSDAITVSGGPDRRRWLILGVIGLAQVMVIMSLAVMNIAG